MAPASDAAMPKQRTKRITGARDLTSREYTEMLREEKRRKEEAEQEKQARRDERERKKRERELQRREREALRGRGCGRGRGRGRGRGQGTDAENDIAPHTTPTTPPTTPPAPVSPTTPTSRPRPSHASSESSSEGDPECGPSTSHPRRQRTLPLRYRQESSDSDQNDGTICMLCQHNEPEGLAAGIVFWIDCNKCGCWVHNVCAFGKATARRQFMCPKCSS